MPSNSEKRKMLEIINRGVPSLDLDGYGREALPTDWDIVETFHDIIMCEYADETETGEVNRGGILLQKEMVHQLWRVVKVLMKGHAVTDRIKVGDYLMIPNDRGIKGVNKDKKNIIFLNEERIFAKVKPRKVV